MSVYRVRKRPVEVGAIQWTGDNLKEVQDFSAGADLARPERMVHGIQFWDVAPEDRGDDPDITAEVYDVKHSTWIGVKNGQWIIKGVHGELYPCDDAVFHMTYDILGEA